MVNIQPPVDMKPPVLPDADVQDDDTIYAPAGNAAKDEEWIPGIPNSYVIFGGVGLIALAIVIGR